MDEEFPWSLRDLVVTKEGHLRFVCLGTDIQLGYVCLEQENDVELGTIVNRYAFVDALMPYSKGTVSTSDWYNKSLYNGLWSKAEAELERMSPGYRARHPLPEEGGEPLLFIVYKTLFYACETRSGKPCFRILREDSMPIDLGQKQLWTN